MSEPLFFYKNQKLRRKKIVFSLLTLLVAIALIYLLPYLVVYILMGFLIAIEIYLLYIFAANKSTVTVDINGIKSNINGIGTITWELVDRFEIKNGINFNALVIVINNQEAFFMNKNSLVKGIMKSNIQRFGSPTIIPETEFHVSLPEAIEMIERYRDFQ